MESSNDETTVVALVARMSVRIDGSIGVGAVVHAKTPKGDHAIR